MSDSQFSNKYAAYVVYLLKKNQKKNLDGVLINNADKFVEYYKFN